MLSPEYLAECTNEILDLYSKLDESIIKLISKRIVKMGFASEATVWQAELLQESNMLYEDVITEISKITNTSEKVIKELFKDAGVRTIEYDNAILKKAGLTPTPIKLSSTMTQILAAGLEKTSGLLNNLTLTTANTAQTKYIQACNLAYMQVSNGFVDYASATRNAVKQAVSQGTTVLYPSGHVDQLDVAVRRSVLTGVNQTAANVQLMNLDNMGCDLVEVTAHAGARPSHALWQGRVYSLSGKTKGYDNFYDKTGYGHGDGLCGWNCRHNFYPFFEGISTLNYTGKDLQELENDGLYELQQQQRAMERSIRKTKRELAGYDAAINEAADNASKMAIKQEFDNASVKLKDKEAKLKEFCKENGLLLDKSRVQAAYGVHKGKATAGFGKSAAQKAVWANKRVEIQRQNDIIIEEIRKVGNLGSKAKIHLSPAKINTSLLDFDKKHIVDERGREITRSQAIQWINEAEISVTVWNGQYERYYGKDGAVYVDLKNMLIRTAYSAEHFENNVISMMEVLKQYGILP